MAFVFFRILAPCFTMRFSTTAVHSGSTPGKRPGVASTTVISVPNFW